MVATAHGPTVTSKPDVVRAFAAGLAGASHYTRNHRDESVEIFNGFPTPTWRWARRRSVISATIRACRQP
jgi:ABC-type nitrate/sulfonate/bicarbonate transport system substrate-binding protein